MAARLNPRHQVMVREKIRAIEILGRMQKHVLGDCSCFEEKGKACSVAGPAGSKMGMYLLSQAIGNPPQEVNERRELSAEVLVLQLVDSLGGDAANKLLQDDSARPLLALMNSRQKAESAGSGVCVDGKLSEKK